MSDSIRDLLLAAKPSLKKEDVTNLLPKEWITLLKDKKLFIEELSGSSMLEYRKQEKQDEVLFLIGCLVDEDSKRVFNAEDKGLISSLPGSVLTKLLTTAKDVNGFFYLPPSP